MRLLTFVVAAALLAGCGTFGSGETPRPATFPHGSQVRSLAEAYHFGGEMIDYYAQGFERANTRRRWFNIGIWAATTYTTGAAGLGAHADNIFVGALTGTALSDLEPIVNEGGPEAWAEALGRTACLSRAAYTGMDPDIARAAALLERRIIAGEASTREADALGAHEGVYMAVMNGYHQAYGAFLSHRVGEPVDTSAMAGMLARARTGAAVDQPAAEPVLDPAETAIVALEAEAERLPDSQQSLVEQIAGGQLLLQSPGRQPQTLASLAESEARAPDSGVSAILAPQLMLVEPAQPGSSGQVEAITPEVRLALQRAFSALRSEIAGAERTDNEQAATAAALRIETANALIARQIGFCLPASAS